MLRFTPLLFAAALLAQPAQAGVKYTWQQVETSSSMPGKLNLELVFSEKAVELGGLSLNFNNNCQFGGACLSKQDSLLSLRYSYDGVNTIDYHHESKPKNVFDHIVLAMTFQPDGLLSGSLFAVTGESHFHMASTGSLFRMIEANSDQPWGCGVPNRQCSGATGLLRAELPQGEVPEPSSAALAGLGLLAAWFGLGRKGRGRAKLPA